eukprot:4497637-Ditylum_brightwellii.AAC.1
MNQDDSSVGLSDNEDSCANTECGFDNDNNNDDYYDERSDEEVAFIELTDDKDETIIPVEIDGNTKKD